MKRFFLYLVLVVVVAIAAAWYAANAWNSYRVRRDEARVAAAEKAESQRLARAFAQLVRDCDEVVIAYRDKADGGQLHEVRFSDAQWTKGVEMLIEGAACAPMPPNPGAIDPIIEPSITRPTVCFYKNRVSVVEIIGGGVLLGSPFPDKVALDNETAGSIRKLIEDRLTAE